MTFLNQKKEFWLTATLFFKSLIFWKICFFQSMISPICWNLLLRSLNPSSQILGESTNVCFRSLFLCQGSKITCRKLDFHQIYEWHLLFHSFSFDKFFKARNFERKTKSVQIDFFQVLLTHFSPISKIFLNDIWHLYFSKEFLTQPSLAKPHSSNW